MNPWSQSPSPPELNLIGVYEGYTGLTTTSFTGCYNGQDFLLE